MPDPITDRRDIEAALRLIEREAETYLALLSGVIADLLGFVAAIGVVAGITAVGAAIVAVRMYETHPRLRVPAILESLGS